MENTPSDSSLEGIRARIEADRLEREARIEEARIHEIPEIRRRIEQDRPAREARIAESIRARQERLRK